MKLLSFEIASKASFGVIVQDGVMELAGRLGSEVHSVQSLFESQRLGMVQELIEHSEPDHSLDAIEFLPPVPSPQKIFCVGVNYTNRNEEYKDESTLPKHPSIFMRTPGSFVGHRGSIARPPESNQLDYEGEIAIVIGIGGRRISERDAARHIVSLTCINEGTIRDWTRHGKFNVTQGKNFDRTGSIGPWIVTGDEFSSFENLSVTTRVNGEIRQNDTTANLLFPFSYLISYISTFSELVPGDVIATGTPTGAGVRFDPPRYLEPDDLLEVEVSGVGTLVNRVVDEAVRNPLTGVKG
mgnify:FL=1